MCKHKAIEKGKCRECGKEMEVWCNHYKGLDKANYCRVGSCEEKIIKRK